MTTKRSRASTRLSTAIRRDKAVYPGNGVVGRERPTWYDVAQLNVTSGAIDIADLGAFPGDDSLCLRVPRGIYAVEARLIDFNGSLCVARVRVRPRKVIPTLGSKQGEIPVDFAAVAIGDIGSIRRKFDDDERDDLNEQSREFMQVEFCKTCRLKLGGKTVSFIVCKAGLGDGSYPIFALKSGRRTVGFEVQFLRDGHVLTHP
jgi:hypothetical protein